VLWTSEGKLFGTAFGGGGSQECYTGCGTVWSFAP
jgi:hypothetical protein